MNRQDRPAVFGHAPYRCRSLCLGFDTIQMEPTTDMAAIAEKYGKTLSFMGNAEVKRCMDIGKKYPGFFMAVGNHIPPNTPVDNVLYYYDAYVEMGKR